MELSQLADKYAGAYGGVDFLSVGTFAARVHDATGSEAATTPLIATVFWQALLYSSAAAPMLQKAGASPIALAKGESYVVQHGTHWPRHDLVILDPGFGAKEPTSLQVEIQPAQLIKGWERFRSERAS